MNSQKNLLESYEIVCDEFAQKFAKKHNLEFDYWINIDNLSGGIASFSELYYFTLENIILDLKHNVPKNEIFKWYEDSLIYSYTCQGDLNYFSYLLSKKLLKKQG